MASWNTPGTVLESALNRGKELLFNHGPSVLGGLGIGVGGWIAAKVARRVVQKVLQAAKLDRISEGTRIGSLIAALGEGWTPSRLLGQLAYGTILLLTLNTVAGHFGLSGLQNAITGVLAYLPKAAGALAIVASATYFGSLAKRTVGAVLRELRNPAAGIVETAVEFGIVLIGALVAMDVLGADLGFITANLTMVLGSALIIIVFLACWSMRRPAEELVNNYYLRRMLSVGDHVQTESYAGTILEFQPLGVILRDPKGDEHFVPANELIRGLRRRQGLSPD